MNDELYEVLETEFLKHHIDEEVEDVLLAMAEALADMNVQGKEITYHESVGHAELEICGVREAEEDDPEEVGVYVKTLSINGREFEIEDYLL